MKCYFLNCLSFINLTKDQLINLSLVMVGLLTVGVALYTAIILLRTLKQIKIQTDEAQFQSRAILAMNQYNIYYKELEGISATFENMNFKKNMERRSFDLKTTFPLNFRQALDFANGKNDKLIGLFTLFMIPDRNSRTKEQETYIQFDILQPLIRGYEHLLLFLNAIKDDNILTDEYKSMFYEKVEYELLQSYLRICNYKFMDKTNDFDLSCYPDQWVNEFKKINNFYINNNAFRYKDLDFYRTTM
jgi:hypothetical protein